MALAFFDLDGTLTRCDTFIPYCMLAFLHRPRRVFALKPLPKACINFCKGNITRQKFKETFLYVFLKGVRRNQIERWNKIFFRFLLSWNIRKEVLKKVRQHQQFGDRVYLVSASPDIYSVPLARHWKLDGVICTVLEWEKERLTGRILGLNCQGEEKARRIRNLFTSRELDGSFAYGNSEGDRELLQCVTFGFKV